MTTIYCNTCSMENYSNTAKCEYCKSTISNENSIALDEWEDDFRFIEEAELKGNVYKLESFNGDFLKVEPCDDSQISQTFKVEPEIQIEPDIVDNDEQTEANIGIEADGTEHRQYQCKECTMCFKRKASLRSHFNAEHYQSDLDSEPSLPKKKSSQMPKSKFRVYRCEICKKITKDFEEHMNHVQTHENLKYSLPSGLIKCNQCNHTFSNNSDFKMHQNKHGDKKVYQCDVCKVFLSNETVLKQHKTRLHESTKSPAQGKRFRCVFCGERFSHQILMTNHKKTHVEDTKIIEETAVVQRVYGRLTYICKMCGKSSSNKSRHTDHLRVHTKEKPFKCDLCGAGFTAKGSLVHHLRLHSDERPFKCHICEATYRHKKNLRKHLFRHTGARPFKCEYCDRTFALNTIKSDHVRLLHTGETPYQCEVCDCWFTTSYLLNGHRRAEHGIDTNSKPRVEILINKTASSGSDSSCEIKR